MMFNFGKDPFTTLLFFSDLNEDKEKEEK